MANFTSTLSSVTSWITSSSNELRVALFFVLVIPLILHYAIYRTRSHKSPSILLLGPSDSGKTSLLSLLEHGHNAETHTTQTSVSVKLSLPSEMGSKLDKYRSMNDPYIHAQQFFFLIDTPGHAKLRHYALEYISNLQNLTGIIFVVNAARIRADDDFTRQTADYLYEVLLRLRKRLNKGESLNDISVLVAANKMDLFTALPAEFVQNILESEFSRIRSLRLNSLPDSEVSLGDIVEEGWDDWLGDKESSIFKFSQLEELDKISIEFQGGNIIGDKPHIENWRHWIAKRL